MKPYLPVAALLVLFGFVGSAGADMIGPPLRGRPAPKAPQLPDVKLQAVPLVIEVTDKAQEAHVQIPNVLLRTRAGLDNPNSDEQRAEGNELPAVHTMMMGVALSLALAFGGLWLTRQSGFSAARNLVILAGAMTFAAITGAVVWANAQPSMVPRTPANPAQKSDPTDKVFVEIMGKNDGTVRLIISKDRLMKLVDETTKKTEEKKQ
jgi:hypothetical protein